MLWTWGWPGSHRAVGTASSLEELARRGVCATWRRCIDVRSWMPPPGLRPICDLGWCAAEQCPCCMSLCHWSSDAMAQHWATACAHWLTPFRIAFPEIVACGCALRRRVRTGLRTGTTVPRAAGAGPQGAGVGGVRVHAMCLCCRYCNRLSCTLITVRGRSRADHTAVLSAHHDKQGLFRAHRFSS